jgi:hypothetical protein
MSGTQNHVHWLKRKEMVSSILWHEAETGFMVGVDFGG